VEGLSLGEIDIGAIVGATYGGFVEEANVLGMLYTFRSVDHMQKAMDGVLGQVIGEKLLKDHKIRLLDGTWYFGTRQLTSKKPIRTPDDLSGMKLRVVPVPVYRVGWGVMGATPTPIVGADLFTSVQTGVVDAQENPPPISKGYGILLVHNHITLSNHVIANVTVSMSERAYSRLPPADRDLIRQAVRDAGVHQKRVAIEAEAKVLDEFKAAGGTVINPDLDAFRAKAATIPDAFLSGKFKGLHQAVQQIQ
jgi:TRAP-type C4-dicarboxylate transport system substrate-binding protein